MNAPSPERGSASTLLDVMFVLEERGTAGVTAVADELGTAKSTAHYHLNKLRNQGLVVRDGTDYKLSLTFLRLGLQARRDIPLFEAAKEEIDKLAAETGELAILSVEQRGLMIYLYKSGGSDAMDIDAPLGGGATMHNRAQGKAMLAQFPETRVEEILDRHGLPETTDQTITTREGLREELREVSEAGIAFNREESLEGIHGVGVPITGDDGTVLGAMSVAGPARRLTGTEFTETYPDLLSRARNVVELNYLHNQSE